MSAILSLYNNIIKFVGIFCDLSRTFDCINLNGYTPFKERIVDLKRPLCTFSTVLCTAYIEFHIIYQFRYDKRDKKKFKSVHIFKFFQIP